MVKFGGSGKSKQACKDRKCDNMIDCKVSHNLPTLKYLSLIEGRRLREQEEQGWQQNASIKKIGSWQQDPDPENCLNLQKY